MTDAAAPLDDLFVTKNPALVAGRRFAWSAEAKPLASRYQILNFTTFLYIGILVVSGLMVGASLYFFMALDSGDVTMTPMLQTMNDIIAVTATYLPVSSIVVTVVCAIAYLMFVYRGMNNLHLSNARNLTITPGWAVAWTFVPFANLAMIYNVMKQIWVASHDPDRGNVSAPFALHLWWALWIVSNLVSRVGEGMLPRDASLIEPGAFTQAYLPGILVTAGAMVAGIISCICLMIIIRQITNAQETLRSTAAFDE